MTTVRDHCITHVTEATAMAVTLTSTALWCLCFSSCSVCCYITVCLRPGAKVQNGSRQGHKSHSLVNIGGYLNFRSCVILSSHVHTRYHTTRVFHSVVEELYGEILPSFFTVIMSPVLRSKRVYIMKSFCDLINSTCDSSQGNPAMLG